MSIDNETTPATQDEYWKDLETVDVDEFEEGIVWQRIRKYLAYELSRNTYGLLCSATGLSDEVTAGRKTGEAYIVETVKHATQSATINTFLELPDIIRESIEQQPENQEKNGQEETESQI